MARKVDINLCKSAHTVIKIGINKGVIRLKLYGVAGFVCGKCRLKSGVLTNES